uniref:Fatty acid hydroxylase domain-containing protein n=1 Tax=Pinguiococcus pyrenoidosus TaxID=172671 RepID=A0A7R9UCP9_9STRA
MAVEVMEAPEWSWGIRLAFAVGVLAGLEMLDTAVTYLFENSEKIPAKGKHHDQLRPVDILCISFNKMTIVLFTWHVISFLWHSSEVDLALADMTFSNTVLAVPALYVVYDFFYSLFHRFLHIKAVYAYVHKHHHVQKVPSRGSNDAINVHPFEFVCGEYNHILAIYLVSQVMRVHAVAAMGFVVLGGLLASLNHTRFDISIPGVYDVKAHDVHHRIPQSNYGQYIMLWDRLMGSFREYR